MSIHAAGTFATADFEILATDEEAGGTTRGRIRMTKTFEGDLEGTSVVEMLTVGTDAGPAAYVAIEHVDGVLHGRKGTFALQHNAGSKDGEQWMTWLIVPTSGTGALAAISGEGQIINADGEHSYTLDYELG
jgi:Protein of unknown function (DUF3224)